MSEAIDTNPPRPRPKAAAPAAFEMPKFEMPNFDMPKLEMPAAFRELAEKSVSQAKETYERMKSAAEKAGSFSPGPGYFVHPHALAVAWGGAWATLGLGLLLGRGPTPRFVGLLALMAAGAVAVIGVLLLVSAIPWYAAVPDGVFPGSLVLVVAGVLLLAKSRAATEGGQSA